MCDLKMYQFDPQTYDEFWCLMADTPENALEKLQAHLKKKRGNKYEYRSWDNSRYVPENWSLWERWSKATVDKLPDDYTINVFEPGEVFEGEWA